MNKTSMRDRNSLSPNSFLFQIGRLLFPELINHGRRMRFRMMVIFSIIAVSLSALTAVALWKDYGVSRGFSSQVRPLK